MIYTTQRLAETLKGGIYFNTVQETVILLPLSWSFYFGSCVFTKCKIQTSCKYQANDSLKLICACQVKT